MTRFRLEDEETDIDCGFDFESFYKGYNCSKLATKVIIDNKDDFHWAHLCEKHANETIIEMEKDYTG